MNDTEASAMVAALLIALGRYLKNGTPLRNEWIPSILLLVAVVATLGLTQGWGEFRAWIAAIMAGLSAVGAHSGTRSTVAAVQNRTLTEPPAANNP